MLFELHVKYKDGTTLRPIVFVEKGDEIKLFPKKDGIVASSCRPFKYKVPEHEILPVCIVKMGEKTFIYPSQIECHSKTTLSDIIEIPSKIKNKEVESNIVVVKPQTKEWKFESISGGGTYVVTQTPKGFKCNCPGMWRAKDRRCKHIKEVETY
jgi:hypothetical protein